MNLKNVSSEELKVKIEALARELEEVRQGYEQYFLGLERVAPEDRRNKLQRDIRSLSGIYIKNTALKFRLDQITARFNSLSQYWNRIMRQIEDGTYERDQFKIKIKYGEDAQTADKQKQPHTKTLDPNIKEKIASLPKDGLTEVVKKYLEASVKAGGKIKSDPAVIREKLKKQAVELKKKFGCKSVNFKIVTENGRPRLKAIPKK